MRSLVFYIQQGRSVAAEPDCPALQVVKGSLLFFGEFYHRGYDCFFQIVLHAPLFDKFMQFSRSSCMQNHLFPLKKKEFCTVVSYVNNKVQCFLLKFRAKLRQIIHSLNILSNYHFFESCFHGREH